MLKFFTPVFASPNSSGTNKSKTKQAGATPAKVGTMGKAGAPTRGLKRTK